MRETVFHDVELFEKASEFLEPTKVEYQAMRFHGLPIGPHL